MGLCRNGQASDSSSADLRGCIRRSAASAPTWGLCQSGQASDSSSTDLRAVCVGRRLQPRHGAFAPACERPKQNRCAETGHRASALLGPSTPTPAAVAPSVTPSPTPEPEMTTQAGYTMAKVKENNSAASCWSVINGNVYDLTQWINSHPGGPSVIRGLCGVDGTSSFNGKHRGQGNPTSTLASYLLGPLAK